MRARVGWVSLLCLVAQASANPRTSNPSAEQAKETAYQAFAVSDYDTAIKEYKRAYLLTGDARLFYNIALSHRKRFLLEQKRADALEARDYFHRFVELIVPARASGAERERLEKTIALARGYLRELEQALASLPVPAPEAPEEPVAPPPAPVSEVVDSEVAAPRSRTLPTVLLITAGVLAASGTATGVLALRAERDASGAFERGDLAVGRERAGDADRYALATDVLAGAALVSGGIGLYLALRRGSTRPARTTVTLSPHGAALTVRY